MILDKDNICIQNKGDIEVPLFSLSEVSKVIDNFSVENNMEESDMRRVTGAIIHIFPREHVAKYGMANDEVVQVPLSSFFGSENTMFLVIVLHLYM